MRVRHLLTTGMAIVLLALPAIVVRAGEPSLAEGWQNVGYLDYKKALVVFSKLAKQAPEGSDEWLEATLGQAMSLQYLQPDVQSDKERAAELLDAVVEQAKGKAKFQPLALLLRGRLADQIDYYGDKPDNETARRCYDRVLKDWPQSDVVDQAVLYLAELDVMTMEPEKVNAGIARLEAWLKERPDNPLAVTQWMLIGQAWTYPLNQPGKAVAAYRHAEALGLPRHIRLDSFYWRLGNLAQKAGEKSLAIEYFRRIIVEVKRSGFAYEAQLRIKDLGGDPPPLENPFESEEGGVQ